MSSCLELLLNIFSYVFVLLGSFGMIIFTRFPFSTVIKDLELSSERFCGLNGYQVWMISWVFIILGTMIQFFLTLCENLNH
jgi:hypothetical protein